MRVLQVHNFYQQPGGEDQVVAAEYELLRARGHEVEQFLAHNDELKGASAWAMARNTVWNADSKRRAAEIIACFEPDVMHCHNTFPLISPSVYAAAQQAGVPVVQTVHNYRLICPAATLVREGKLCEDCLGKGFPYPAVVHSCYRGNRGASAVSAAMLALHRLRGTWQRQVNLYIALTDFVKGKLVEGGFRPEQIVVKPNFLPRDPGAGAGDEGYALFAGRLVPEKGLKTLLDAWAHVSALPLLIAGDGPLRDYVAGRAATLPNVTLLGFEPRDKLIERMKRAAMMVVPSEWYEGFPMTIVEAMACGTPIVASDLGSLREIVQEGATGARFAAGDARALASAVERLVREKPAALRQSVRHRFETQYSADANYLQLVSIYAQAEKGLIQSL